MPQENKLVSNDFKDNEQYLISYTSDESGTKFRLRQTKFWLFEFRNSR